MAVTVQQILQQHFNGFTSRQPLSRDMMVAAMRRFASGGRHCFLDFLLLHDDAVPGGAFVGAAYRSLTPAQRSGANGER